MTILPRCLLLALLCCVLAPAGEQRIDDIAYRTGELSAAERERCVLDLYLPAGTSFPTLVWLHGGGITEGRWDDTFTSGIASAFQRAGIAVAAVGYRLSPQTRYPGYIEDAAAAFAFVQRTIATHGGDPRVVFLGGHSAGGYLTMMVGLDRSYLAKLGVAEDAIAGLIPLSGQTITHKAVRSERGLAPEVVVVDEAAPLRHVRKQTPPLLILAAEHDMAARLEENQLLAACFKAAGNPAVSFHLASGRTHGTIAEWMARPDDAVAQVVLDFIKTVSAKRTAP